MSKFRFQVEDAGCGDQMFDLTSEPFDDEDLDSIAAEAGEQFYNDHDGWEHDWPLTFVLFRGDDKLGRFEVELETEPHFSAWKRDDVPEPAR